MEPPTNQRFPPFHCNFIIELVACWYLLLCSGFKRGVTWLTHSFTHRTLLTLWKWIQFQCHHLSLLLTSLARNRNGLGSDEAIYSSGDRDPHTLASKYGEGNHPWVQSVIKQILFDVRKCFLVTMNGGKVSDYWSWLYFLSSLYFT